MLCSLPDTAFLIPVERAEIRGTYYFKRGKVTIGKRPVSIDTYILEVYLVIDTFYV